MAENYLRFVFVALAVQCIFAAAVRDPRRDDSHMSDGFEDVRENKRQLEIKRAQMSDGFEDVHENKRQLEIKRAQLDAGQLRHLDQRLRRDIHRDMADMADLEQQLAESLNTVRETKRQLEIKRSHRSGGKVHYLEQRLFDDFHRELSDMADLEQQLAGSLDIVQEKKRQLEIKRSQFSSDLN